MITGTGAKIQGYSTGLAVMDFSCFLPRRWGPSLGGENTRVIELSTRKKWPLIIVCASGGARMYEGMLSLMQMAKTSGALASAPGRPDSWVCVRAHQSGRRPGSWPAIVAWATS